MQYFVYKIGNGPDRKVSTFRDYDEACKDATQRAEKTGHTYTVIEYVYRGVFTAHPASTATVGA